MNATNIYSLRRVGNPMTLTRLMGNTPCQINQRLQKNENLEHLNEGNLTIVWDGLERVHLHDLILDKKKTTSFF